MIYLKHYWVREGQYLTEPGQNGPEQHHPEGIDGLSVKYWLTDERGVDYCLSTASDNALINEVNPGMKVLSRGEWNQIVSQISSDNSSPIVFPDWNTFKTTAVSSPKLNTFIGELIATAPVAATALPATLLLIETGNYQDFQNTWNAIKEATTVPDDLITEMTTLATSCNLPQEFINILS